MVWVYRILLLELFESLCLVGLLRDSFHLAQLLSVRGHVFDRADDSLGPACVFVAPFGLLQVDDDLPVLGQVAVFVKFDREVRVDSAFRNVNLLPVCFLENKKP